MTSFYNLDAIIAIGYRVTKSENVIVNEASYLLDVLANYTAALNMLDDYDHQRLKIRTSENDTYFRINYTEATEFEKALEKRAGLKFACLDEVAFNMSFVSKAMMKQRIALQNYKSDYFIYLQKHLG